MVVVELRNGSVTFPVLNHATSEVPGGVPPDQLLPALKSVPVFAQSRCALKIEIGKEQSAMEQIRNGWWAPLKQDRFMMGGWGGAATCGRMSGTRIYGERRTRGSAARVIGYTLMVISLAVGGASP